MDYIKEIEKWANQGIAIEHMVVDQVENGTYEEESDDPRYTFTLNAFKLGDMSELFSVAGYETLIEGYEELFKHLNNNPDKRFKLK